MFHSLNRVPNCCKNQVRVFAFLEAPLLLNLNIGRADGPADGVNAADAGSDKAVRKRISRAPSFPILQMPSVQVICWMLNRSNKGEGPCVPMQAITCFMGKLIPLLQFDSLPI